LLGLYSSSQLADKTHHNRVHLCEAPYKGAGLLSTLFGGKSLLFSLEPGKVQPVENSVKVVGSIYSFDAGQVIKEKKPAGPVVFICDGGADDREAAEELAIRELMLSYDAMEEGEVVAVKFESYYPRFFLLCNALAFSRRELTCDVRNPLSNEGFFIGTKGETGPLLNMAPLVDAQKEVLSCINQRNLASSARAVMLNMRSTATSFGVPITEYVQGEAKDVVGSQEYLDLTRMFFPTPVETVVPIKEVALPTPSEVIIQAGMDSYLLADTLIRSYALMDTITSINHAVSAVVRPGFTNGMLDKDWIVGLNPRGHPRSYENVYYSMTSGNGLHYSPKLPAQTLGVLRERYVGKKSEMVYTNQSEVLARLMVEEFVKEHMEPLKPMDPFENQQIYSEYVKSAGQKHYASQFIGQDNPDVNLIRFHLKDIFKPAKENSQPDPTKVGQGISAWSKDLQVAFGACMRVINNRFKSHLKAHVVYENRMTDLQMRTFLIDAMKTVPAVAKIGVSDFKMFDANQNRFTQLLEKLVLRYLGVSEEFIKAYYANRESYTIQSQSVRARVKDSKTSGEPGTLLLNTIVAAVIANFLLRGDGPAAFAIKGDDGFKYQSNLSIDEQRKQEVLEHVNLEIKLNISGTAEFCGYAIAGGSFVPSVFRALDRVLGKRFRDYAHFCEYQKSLRDWVRINEPSRANIIAVCAFMYNQPMPATAAAYEVVQSCAHIDEAQFKQVFTKRVEDLTFQKADGVVSL